MACSIMNEKIRMHVETGDRDISVILSQDTENKEKNSKSSALQNSEINRMTLSSMLRRARRKERVVTVADSWETLLDRAREACANGNAV